MHYNGSGVWTIARHHRLQIAAAPTRAKAMLTLKHRWRERGPLKPGDMQVETPEWMKDGPEYK
jgi:hypothetical protein